MLSVNKYYFDFNRLETATKKKVFFAYGGFIAICGVGHLEDMLAFYVRDYFLFTLWNTLTTMISAYAVFITFKVRKELLIRTDGFGRHSEK